MYSARRWLGMSQHRFFHLFKQSPYFTNIRIVSYGTFFLFAVFQSFFYRVIDFPHPSSRLISYIFILFPVKLEVLLLFLAS